MENFEIFDKKLLILYILDTANKNLSIDQLFNLLGSLLGINYFDLCEYIDELKNNNFIDMELSDNTYFYYLTKTGKKTLQELIELIPGLDLYKLKKIISSDIKQIKQEYEIGTSMLPLKDGQYKIKCYIKDADEEIFNISLFAGNKEDAKIISKNWQENNASIHSKILNMLTEE